MRNGKFEGYLLVADFDDTFCPEHGAPVPEENRRAAQHFMDEGGLFTIATGRDVRSYYSIPGQIHRQRAARTQQRAP